MTERVLYRIPTRIKSIHEEFHQYNWRMSEDGRPTFDKRSRGWFIAMEGSMESLYVSPDKPTSLAVGDTVFIDIVKLEDKPDAQVPQEASSDRGRPMERQGFPVAYSELDHGGVP